MFDRQESVYMCPFPIFRLLGRCSTRATMAAAARYFLKAEALTRTFHVKACDQCREKGCLCRILPVGCRLLRYSQWVGIYLGLREMMYALMQSRCRDSRAGAAAGRVSKRRMESIFGSEKRVAGEGADANLYQMALHDQERQGRSPWARPGMTFPALVS
jgi:hypothetical protein